MNKQVMFSLPDQLIIRMKAAIPAKERSRIIAKLLEKEIKAREEALYLAAKEFAESQGYREEVESLDEEYKKDGLEDDK